MINHISNKIKNIIFIFLFLIAFICISFSVHTVPSFAATVTVNDLSGDRYNGTLFGYGMTTTN